MSFSFDTFSFNTLINPNKKAIIGADETLNWTDFKTRVEQLASYLIKEVKDDKPIIVYGHKEANMVVSFYACMLAQRTYIPVDIIYPKERIEAIIEATGTTTYINCSTTEIAIEQLNAIHPTQLPQQEIAPFEQNTAVDSVVYTLFTSGSTGTPKGVQITRSAIRTFVDWMTTDFGFTHTDVFINSALFSFDLSVFELMTFGALGASLLLNSTQHIAQPDGLLERIAENQGSVWVATPSFILKFATLGEHAIKSNLNYFLFCGEVLPTTTAQALLTHFPSTKVLNTYGPTEATVATTLVEITQEIIDTYNPLPVGYPKRNSTLKIESDEIVIFGENVSIGYINRPDLNATKFGVENNIRFFRTGDLGYFQDGMLFCKGRNDDQIKLHGYRIELNEITSHLLAIPWIKDATVLALRRNGEVKKLMGVVVVETADIQKNPETKTRISEELRKTIPEYMIPSDFRFIDVLPLNQNGKIDKKSLEEWVLKNR